MRKFLYGFDSELVWPLKFYTFVPVGKKMGFYFYLFFMNLVDMYLNQLEIILDILLS